MQQIERECFSVAKRRSIYTTLAFLALLGAPYIYIYICDISSLRVKEKHGNSKNANFVQKFFYGLLKDSKCHINSLEGFFPYINATVAMTSVFTSITQVI